MARISSYPVDQNIVGQDKLLGTDNAGLITKNYTLDGISSWMNESGSVAIAGQSNYSFDVPNATVGTISGVAPNTPFANISSLRFSKTSAAGADVIAFLSTLVGKTTLLARLDNLNNFGVYNLLSLAVDPSDADFYNATFSTQAANGNITAGKYYGFAAFPSLDAGDKNFTFIAPTPAVAVWNVTHNLGKFPSVSIATSAGDAVYADIDYIDSDSLTITFSGATGGKAYMN
jgi:hypothetical protein